jgi:uncharacterized membrane protein YuzA (DUF378 family)
MKPLHYTCLTLAIIGAVNWGLWGFFQFDLAAALCGGQSAPLSRVISGAVGLAGLVLIGTSVAASEHGALGAGRPGAAFPAR